MLYNQCSALQYWRLWMASYTTRLQDTRYKIQDTRYKIQDTKHKQSFLNQQLHS